MYKCFLCGEDVTMQAHKAVRGIEDAVLWPEKLDDRMARCKVKSYCYYTACFDGRGIAVVCPDCFVDAFPDKDRAMAITTLLDSYFDYLPMSMTLVHAVEGLIESFHLDGPEAKDVLSAYVRKRAKNPPM